MMEGSITTSSQSADEQVRTNYVEVWSATAYLVFWANSDMLMTVKLAFMHRRKAHLWMMQTL